MYAETLDAFDAFMGDTLYDMFCEMDRWIYDNASGVADYETALTEWMKDDLHTYRKMEQYAFDWHAVFTDLCYEMRLFYFHYTLFLLKNFRPIQDLLLLTDEIVYSYPPIKRLKSELDKLCETIEKVPHSPDLSFRKYQETKINVERAHINSETRMLYYLMERYINDYHERETLFSKVIRDYQINPRRGFGFYNV